jgi:hypothetical protein
MPRAVPWCEDVFGSMDAKLVLSLSLSLSAATVDERGAGGVQKADNTSREGSVVQKAQTSEEGSVVQNTSIATSSSRLFAMSLGAFM